MRVRAEHTPGFSLLGAGGGTQSRLYLPRFINAEAFAEIRADTKVKLTG